MKHYWNDIGPDIKKDRFFFTKDQMLILLSGGMFLLMTAVVFYDQLAAAVLLSPYLYIWYQKQMKKRQEAKKDQLRQESREFLQSLMNCLSAGYSLERSIPVIRKEMELLYSHKKSMIIPELKIIEQKLKMNQSMEDAFEEFAKKYDNEDLLQFAFILRIAKKRGGNLIQVLEKTIDTIGRKHQVEEEIKTILAGRVFEKNIMKMVPFLLICYLRVFNPGYLEIMYETLAGRICMTISLLSMAAAGKMADRIVEIGV